MLTLDTHTKPYWECYEKPLVRDLAWLIFTPNLVENTAIENTAASHTFIATHLQKDAVLNWLTSLDKLKESTLEEHVNRRKFRRLGLYCEALFEFIYTHGFAASCVKNRLLARNIQIFSDDEKTTLGELDFITATRAVTRPSTDLSNLIFDSINHIEMAIKFFLIDDNSPLTPLESQTVCSPESQAHTGEAETETVKVIPSNAKYCIGPNRRDRLDLKFSRLLSHQLPIGQSDEANKKLARMGLLASTIDPQLLVKGQIFIPFKQRNRLSEFAASFDYLSLSDDQTWCRVHQLANTLDKFSCEHALTKPQEYEEQVCKWLLIKKLDWLCGERLTKKGFEEAFTREEIIDNILTNQSDNIDFKPPIFLRAVIKQAQQYNEKGRLMVVHNEWPNFTA